jgi:NTE family protein
MLFQPSCLHLFQNNDRFEIMTLTEKLSNQPFVLSLSSGYFGFFAHLGFVEAMLAEGLRPASITGASAGAIVGACLASGLKINDIKTEFINLEKKHFWDPKFGFGYLGGKLLEQSLGKFLKSEMKDLEIPLQISTFNIRKRKTEIFESGDLAKIVRASCAIPFFFHPVRIGKNFYWDGGLQDKMAWSKLAPGALILGHDLASHPVIDWFE